MTSSPASKAFLLLTHSGAVGFDVTLAATAVAFLGRGGGAGGLDVALTAAIVALLGGGWFGRLGAGGGLVGGGEAVEAASVGEAAVLG